VRGKAATWWVRFHRSRLSCQLSFGADFAGAVFCVRIQSCSMTRRSI